VHGIFFSLQIGQSALSVYILIGFVQLVTYLHKQDFSTMYLRTSYFIHLLAQPTGITIPLFYLLIPLLLKSYVCGPVHCRVPTYVLKHQ